MNISMNKLLRNELIYESMFFQTSIIKESSFAHIENRNSQFTVTLLVIKIDSNMSFGEDKEDVILETYR